jgi:glycosyltransferase involved in cell wall biosynthesis
MASGIPVVAADVPVFREIGADAASYVDPFDTGALAGAIEEALFTPSRTALTLRGSERVRSFSWDATARRLLSLFDEVLSERAD